MDVLRPHSIASAMLCALAVFVGACASVSSAEPRQYLDKTTAATITTVDAPWILMRERPQVAVNLRDYLSIYALDVNRTGQHRCYLLVQEWSTIGDIAARAAQASEIAIHADGRRIQLHAAREEARDLGIGDSIAPDRGRGSHLLYYPVSRDVLEFVSTAENVTVQVSSQDLSSAYEIWRDGRSALAQFVKAVEKC